MGRYKEYLKESIKIQLKQIKEYKANFYFSTFLTLFYTAIMIIFLNVVYGQFNDMLNWSFNEYYFFVVFSAMVVMPCAPFYFNQILNRFLLWGIITIYSTRPLNTAFQYYVNTINLVFAVPMIYYAIALIYFFLYMEKFLLIKFLFVLVFSLFGGLFIILLYRTIDALAFFMKGNLTLSSFFQQTTGTFNRFPVTMFDGWIKTLAFILPNVYFNAYATEIYFGKISYLQALDLFYIMITFIIILTTTIFFLWKIGLKKYEAFG
jgi:ABC-2 type transport system permease protein